MLEAFISAHSLPWLAGLAAALLATGLVAGLLAGLLGVGGGIVIVPVLFHLFSLLGVDPSVRMHVAVGTSLATIVPTSISSALAHRRRGNLDMALVRRLLPSVIVGVALGTLASGHLSGQALTAVFAVVALAVAAHMAFRREGSALAHGLPGRTGTAAIGAGIGGFSTLMGIGGGTLSVPILSALRVPMHTAVGTAALLGTVISIPGAIGFVIGGWAAPLRPPGSLGHVNLLGLALIVPATLLTTGWGVRLASRVDGRRLRLWFAFFLTLTALRMVAGLLA
ncbi:sulfite exporter TauE/SafE family protein [Pseudorhodoferax sp.]|uniref:sulfite exporter TauE/SafE family protein n=1 Tax=Pseudorhodoferax sp. TaxID=1993553 RepID=UPI002DD6A842|nr:sulfite exporter TauE/SafE family protein [Pseudorhodoferax sp.]